MTSPEILLAEADAMERLAAVVSYAPDKQRLLSRAAELRRHAGVQPPTEEAARPEALRRSR